MKEFWQMTPDERYADAIERHERSAFSDKRHPPMRELVERIHRVEIEVAVVKEN
jgi:hypothetical protein